ncbi:MAG: PHP domain-containing protein [Clostridia bacterium]|nr:PHP domain-containing protein [Clostridia bacterium]
MNLIGMDLHIHSALSPCASLEMTPPEVFKRAREVGLQALVIADHNSAENQKAFIECAKEMNFLYLPGMEVQSKEDVHILCIFNTLEQVLSLQELVYSQLPELENNKELFGQQAIVDSRGEIIGELERMLLTATNISVDDIVGAVKQLGGLALPAHIDRPSFSLWFHLGFIPEYLGFIGVEMSPRLPRNQEQMRFIKEHNLGIVVSSDAHWLNQLLGPQTWACVEDFTVEELSLAIQGKEGRYLKYGKGLVEET